MPAESAVLCMRISLVHVSEHAHALLCQCMLHNNSEHRSRLKVVYAVLPAGHHAHHAQGQCAGHGAQGAGPGEAGAGARCALAPERPCAGHTHWQDSRLPGLTAAMADSCCACECVDESAAVTCGCSRFGCEVDAK